MWAEWSAATSGAVDPANERRRLWEIEVAGLPVLDLRRGEARDALGVDLGGLTGARASAQAVAEHARSLGAEGMLVPSAARAGAWNLVVFPDGFARLAVGRGRNLQPRPPAR